MTTVIRLHETGGPEVLRVETTSVGDPGPGQVRLAQSACGVNYIDTYHRSGLYPIPGGLPNGLGLEGCGIIEAIGDGVTGLNVGDRVAYGTGPIGGYAAARVMPATGLVKVPDAITDVQAAGMMLRGLTVQYLIRRLFKVEPGMTVLFHAAAGGVGLIACQWLKALGATVIGTVSTEEKAELARAHGCDHPVLYTREDFVARVKEITGGKGVPVVYDGVGKTVFEKSLDCLAPRGLMCTFGNASGPVPDISPLTLSQKGSLFLTRPTLAHYTANRTELEEAAADLFSVVANGTVKIEVGQTFALTDARAAHEALESRATTGSTVLTV